MVLHPFTKAKEALAYYRDFAKAIPDEVNTIGGLLTSPDGDLMAFIAVCYNGSLDAGERVLRPLREFGPPLADQIRPMAYREVQTRLDPRRCVGGATISNRASCAASATTPSMR